MTTWDWVLHNINICNVSSNGVEWSLIFGVTTWLLWQWRNQFVFGNQNIPFETAINNIILRCKEIHISEACCSSLPSTYSSGSQPVYWCPPDVGFVKLNTDGSFMPHSMKAGSGGLFRDSNGKWILGFTRNCGICTTLEAELWGILTGLKIAQEKGFTKLVIESDCLTAVEAINGTFKVFGNSSNLIRAITCRMRDALEVQCVFKGRDSNSCADWLAREGAKASSNELTLLTSPPDSMRALLLADWNEVVI